MGGEWWGECPHEPMEEMHGSSTSTALRAEYEYDGEKARSDSAEIRD
jgi:hypothetical protein